MSTRFSATCVDDRIDCLIKVPRKANLRDGISEEFEVCFKNVFSIPECGESSKKTGQKTRFFRLRKQNLVGKLGFFSGWKMFPFFFWIRATLVFQYQIFPETTSRKRSISFYELQRGPKSGKCA
jgi:hypothetical protein